MLSEMESVYPLGHVVEVEGSNRPTARQQGGTADPPGKCAPFYQ